MTMKPEKGVSPLRKTSWIVSAVVLALLAFVFLLPTPESHPQSFALPEGNNFSLHHVTVFNGYTWRENVTLHIKAGRISTSAASHAQHIDGEQRFVIPGLIDAHTHTWGNALNQALQFGVTTELDMFTDYRFLQARKPGRDDIMLRSEADFFSAATLVTSPGGHGTEYGMHIPTLTSSEQARSFVAARIAEGADYIKIVYDAHPDIAKGGRRFTSIDYATLEAAIDAAHDNHVMAVVHIMDPDSAKDAVRAGADGLVHTFAGTKVDDALLNALKDNDVFVIPTLSVLAAFASEARAQRLMQSPYFAPHITPGMKSTLFTPYQAKVHNAAYFQSALHNTRTMHEFGITLLAGTDAPNLNLAHGISLHDELALLVESGLSPTEALQAATSNVTNTFPVGSRGVLRVGSRADFLVLDKDPRQHIENTHSMRLVVKNGFAQAPFDASMGVKALLSEQGQVSQFDRDSLSPQFGHSFVASSDQMMQGNSTANIMHNKQGCAENGSLHVSGTVGKRFPYPWSGALWQLGNTIQQGENISNFTHLSFHVKGHPGRYRLMILTPDSPQPAEQPFEVTDTCANITLAFDSFHGVDWQNVSGVGWMAGPETPEYNLQLDSIRLK